MLEVRGADVLLRYNDTFYQEFAAVTCKAQKDGWVYYLGCGLEQPVLDKILEAICAQQTISGEASPAGVEIICRGSGKDWVRMVINHNSREAEYDGEPLAPFQCRVESAGQ